MTEHLGWHRWWREAAIALAGSGAALLVAWVLWPAAQDWQRERHAERMRSMPVLLTTTEVLSRSDTEVIFRVRGERLRGDECQFLGRQAFAIGSGGRLLATDAARLDRPEGQGSLPRGSVDFGRWRVAVNEGDGAVVWALYLCEQIDVRSVFAFVPRVE